MQAWLRPARSRTQIRYRPAPKLLWCTHGHGRSRRPVHVRSYYVFDDAQRRWVMRALAKEGDLRTRWKRESKQQFGKRDMMKTGVCYTAYLSSGILPAGDEPDQYLHSRSEMVMWVYIVSCLIHIHCTNEVSLRPLCCLAGSAVALWLSPFGE